MSEDLERRICDDAWSKVRWLTLGLAPAPAIYIYVGVMLMRRGAVAHPVVTTDDARNALLLGLIAAGALCIAAAVMLSRRLRTQAPPPSLSAAAQRWVQTRVLTLGLAEFPAVLGLVYALLTGDLRRMIALAAAGAAALIFFLPRRAALEDYVRRGGRTGDAPT